MRLTGIKHRRNRDGSFRVYVQRKDGRLVRLPSLPETDPEFIAAYLEAVREAPALKVQTSLQGTLAALVIDYQQSSAFRGLRPMTQTQRRREFDRLIALKDGAGGRFKVGEITADAIRANLESLSPGAASNRLKAWRAVMSHAVDRSWVDRSPAHDVRAPQPKSGDGHRAWTKDDIEAFRAALPIGTRHRLAMELAYWTGARRGDLVQLGPQHIGVDGWLQYRQSKTGRDVAVPFRADQVPHPALAKEWAHLERALVLARPGLLYLATQTGAPRSSNAVGEWFRRACKVAGLPDGCSMHGLRKARASALAELGWSEGQIMAWTGHDTMKEVVRYTRSARRRVMIRGALGPSDRNVVALRSSEE